MKIKYVVFENGNNELKLTLDEARELYYNLKELFDKPLQITTYPISSPPEYPSYQITYTDNTKPEHHTTGYVSTPSNVSKITPVGDTDYVVGRFVD